MATNVKFKRDAHDREICEIFLSSNATGAFLAHDKIPGEDVTYAQRYGREYAAFKASDPEPRAGTDEQSHDDATITANEPPVNTLPTGGLLTSTILPPPDHAPPAAPKAEDEPRPEPQPPVGNEPPQPLGTLDDKEKAL